MNIQKFFPPGSTQHFNLNQWVDLNEKLRQQEVFMMEKTGQRMFGLVYADEPTVSRAKHHALFCTVTDPVPGMPEGIMYTIENVGSREIWQDALQALCDHMKFAR